MNVFKFISYAAMIIILAVLVRFIFSTPSSDGHELSVNPVGAFTTGFEVICVGFIGVIAAILSKKT